MEWLWPIHSHFVPFLWIFQKCMQMLPVVGGVIFVLLVVFAIYVRSVPPKEPSLDQPQFQGGTPEFMNVDTEPMVKEALEEASEVLKNLDDEKGEPVETIEL